MLVHRADSASVFSDGRSRWGFSSPAPEVRAARERGRTVSRFRVMLGHIAGQPLVGGQHPAGA
jgi:hypothetical protein